MSRGQEESEGHHHNESCYTIKTELTCGEEEHRHSEENGCYDADGNLVCQMQEHVHDDSCYKEDRILTCGLEESDGHRHTDACYEKVLVCGKEVHTHSEKCYEAGGRDGTVKINNTGYTNWLTRDTSVPGTVSYQIAIENTPLGITVRKTDEAGNALSGSTFTLCKKSDSGSFVLVTEYGLGQDGLIDLTDRTEMTFTGMSNGIYLLSETLAPPGYIILTKDTYFSVANGTVTLTDENGDAKTYTDVSLLDDNTTIAVKTIPARLSPIPEAPGPDCFTSSVPSWPSSPVRPCCAGTYAGE